MNHNNLYYKIILFLVLCGIFTVTGAFADDDTDELSDQSIVSTGDSFAQNGILKLIDSRISTRTFSDESIDDKTTDEILWAAFGKNSHGTRTIPTSQGQENLKVYAIRADGAFLYDGEQLNKVSDADLRPLFALQDFVATAPLTLLFAGSDKDNSPLHAGSSYQNVALYCAERGLGTVVRAFFDKQAVEEALSFTEGEFAIISQTIGWIG